MSQCFLYFSKATQKPRKIVSRFQEEKNTTVGNPVPGQVDQNFAKCFAKRGFSFSRIFNFKHSSNISLVVLIIHAECFTHGNKSGLVGAQYICISPWVKFRSLPTPSQVNSAFSNLKEISEILGNS